VKRLDLGEIQVPFAETAEVPRTQERFYGLWEVQLCFCERAITALLTWWPIYLHSLML
jgi:hypothetical protein